MRSVARMVATLEMQDRMSAQLKRATDNLINMGRRASNAIGRATSAAGGFNRELRGVGVSLQGIGGLTVTAFGRATVAIASAIGGIRGAVNTASGFEDVLTEISARAGVVGKDLKKVSDFSLDLGRKTVFTGTEIAKSILELTLVGRTAEEAMALMPGIADLAVAGGTGLQRASQIVVNTINQFGLGFDKSSEVANTFVSAAAASSASVEDLAQAFENAGPTLASLGFNLTELSAAFAILADTGNKGAEAGTRIRSGLLKLVSTKPAEKALKQLGVNISYTVEELEALAKKRGIELPVTVKRFNAMSPQEIAIAQRGLELAKGRLAVLGEKLEAGTINASELKEIQRIQKEIADYNQKLARARGGSYRVVDEQALARLGLPRVGQLKSLSDILKELKPRLEKLNDVQRNAMLKDLFGAYGFSTFAALLNSNTSIDQMIAKMEKQAKAAEVARARMATFSGAIKELQGATETLIIKAFTPLMKGILEPIVRRLTRFISFLSDAIDAIEDFFKDKRVASALKRYADAFKRGLQNITAPFQKVFTSVKRGVKNLFLKILGVPENEGEFLDATRPIEKTTKRLGERIRERLIEIFTIKERVRTSIKLLVDIIVGISFPFREKFFEKIVKPIALSIANVLGVLESPFAHSVVDALRNFVSANEKAFQDELDAAGGPGGETRLKAQELGRRIIEGIKEGINTVRKNIEENPVYRFIRFVLIDPVFNLLNKLIGIPLQLAQQNIQNIIDGIKNALTQSGVDPEKLGSNLTVIAIAIERFLNAISRFAEANPNLMSDIAGLISNIVLSMMGLGALIRVLALPRLFQSLTGFIDALVNTDYKKAEENAQLFIGILMVLFAPKVLELLSSVATTNVVLNGGLLLVGVTVLGSVVGEISELLEGISELSDGSASEEVLKRLPGLLMRVASVIVSLRLAQAAMGHIQPGQSSEQFVQNFVNRTNALVQGLRGIRQPLQDINDNLQRIEAIRQRHSLFTQGGYAQGATWAEILDAARHVITTVGPRLNDIADELTRRPPTNYRIGTSLAAVTENLASIRNFVTNVQHMSADTYLNRDISERVNRAQARIENLAQRYQTARARGTNPNQRIEAFRQIRDQLIEEIQGIQRLAGEIYNMTENNRFNGLDRRVGVVMRGINAMVNIAGRIGRGLIRILDNLGASELGRTLRTVGSGLAIQGMIMSLLNVFHTIADANLSESEKQANIFKNILNIIGGAIAAFVIISVPGALLAAIGAIAGLLTALGAIKVDHVTIFERLNRAIRALFGADAPTEATDIFRKMQNLAARGVSGFEGFKENIDKVPETILVDFNRSVQIAQRRMGASANEFGTDVRQYAETIGLLMASGAIQGSQDAYQNLSRTLLSFDQSTGKQEAIDAINKAVGISPEDLLKGKADFVSRTYDAVKGFIDRNYTGSQGILPDLIKVALLGGRDSLEGASAKEIEDAYQNAARIFLGFEDIEKLAEGSIDGVINFFKQNFPTAFEQVMSNKIGVLTSSVVTFTAAETVSAAINEAIIQEMMKILGISEKQIVSGDELAAERVKAGLIISSIAQQAFEQLFGVVAVPPVSIGAMPAQPLTVQPSAFNAATFIEAALKAALGLDKEGWLDAAIGTLASDISSGLVGLSDEQRNQIVDAYKERLKKWAEQLPTVLAERMSKGEIPVDINEMTLQWMEMILPESGRGESGIVSAFVARLKEGQDRFKALLAIEIEKLLGGTGGTAVNQESTSAFIQLITQALSDISPQNLDKAIVDYLSTVKIAPDSATGKAFSDWIKQLRENIGKALVGEGEVSSTIQEGGIVAQIIGAIPKEELAVLPELLINAFDGFAESSDPALVAATGLRDVIAQTTSEILPAFRDKSVEVADAIGNAFVALTPKMTRPFAETVRNIGTILSGLKGMPDLNASGANMIAVADNWMAANIQSRDKGGFGKAGQPYLIGRGAQPELFIPQTNGYFIPRADRLAPPVARSSNNTIIQIQNVTVNGVQNPREFFDKLQNEARRRNVEL